MHRAKWFWKTVFLSILVLLVALCATCYKLSLVELDDRNINRVIGHDINELNGEDAMVKIMFRVMNVDLSKNKIETHLTFEPSKVLIKEDGRLKEDLVFNFVYYRSAYNVNDTLGPVEILYPILEGSTIYYPLDEFYTELNLSIFSLTTKRSIPIELHLKAGRASFKFSIEQIAMDQSSSNTSSSLRLGLRVERQATVKFFSIFVVLVMWMLSLAVFQLALWTLVFSDERPGASYLGLGSALLFALPSLRSTQPGIPPIGALVDTIGFFWNMVLVALSSVIVIGVWIVRFNNTSSS